VQLNELQHDALVELLNIGFGRAGASLSKLTQQRVLLDVPHVAIHPVSQLTEVLTELVKDEVASVHQMFSGPVAGDALLILDPVAAATLKELLTDEPALPLNLDASSREVLTEVGNILLNACIGTFGNLLRVPMSFSVPDIDVASLQMVVDRILGEGDAFRYALVITAGFRLRDAEVTGMSSSSSPSSR
jgi:chemotaxis protein CheC